MRKDWCYQPAIHHPPGKYVPTWSYGDLGDYTLCQLPDQAFPREWQMEVGKWDHCQAAIIHLIQIFCRVELGNIGSTTGFSAHWDNFSTPWISVGVAAATNQNANALCSYYWIPEASLNKWFPVCCKSFFRDYD